MLVAISIPIFNNQLEKSREATDAANLRNAYAACSTALLDANASSTGYSKAVTLVQTTAGFATTGDTKIGDCQLSTLGNDVIGSKATVYVNVNPSGNVTITKTASYDVMS